ncbi:hypothetical protein [Desulfoscipio geothermicus]|uniref:Uncharacterized protein n=1 Tax=Desulfoscipio geothermicus DSM 3669 TaxID=1121426 RepID=A0A1I6E4U9_9FIRM|nr:hypothetical protein [Desulfoscipio geothermicus]SFR12779.1 hypothetical protein SAMN05660706_1266 [Desulfoscipio geothermicus DSM 3669]
MSNEQRDLTLTAESLRARQEVPVLTETELNVLESDYIDSFDDALAVLEDAQQVNPPDILGLDNGHP